MVLFVNACVRGESRTIWLADRLLAQMKEPWEELRLEEVPFPSVDEAFLKRRDALIAKERFEDPLFHLARQFAEADQIIIAAPYWDLSFPAALKQYFEQINVLGITFRYTPEGVPQGLCRARRLLYVTTAGGDFAPEEYGFGYVRALARNYYGIPEVQQLKAAGLDLIGADPEAILQNAWECSPLRIWPL
ncbi:MAG: NAD(P)H-dependent oxidoreductase [Lachnospiraceae bacterium]|nr:NAD(P)H-dependent oxidoreductase [Lachnospiraceae bacterium]